MQHTIDLNGVPANLVHHFIRVAGQNPLARAWLHTLPTHQRELGKPMNGIHDSLGHATSSVRIALSVIGVDGADIVPRGWGDDNIHSLGRRTIRIIAGKHAVGAQFSYQVGKRNAQTGPKLVLALLD